jgi:hypothetical protein
MDRISLNTCYPIFTDRGVWRYFAARRATVTRPPVLLSGFPNPENSSMWHARSAVGAACVVSRRRCARIVEAAATAKAAKASCRRFCLGCLL